MQYETTEPIVAEFCHPKIALNIPHPPFDLSSGLQQLTCLGCQLFEVFRDVYHTDFLMSYVPGPLPSSAASLPMTFAHWYASKSHTPRENSPAPTKYKTQLEATMKYLIFTNAPPLFHSQLDEVIVKTYR